MPPVKKSLGAFGEAWAVGHLSRLGYEIIDRNVRYRCGELDIVARHEGDLVFIEVKARRSDRYGTPEASIDAKRFARLASAVDEYLARNDLHPPSYRVDVVAIEIGLEGTVRRCEVLRAVGPPSY